MYAAWAVIRRRVSVTLCNELWCWPAFGNETFSQARPGLGLRRGGRRTARDVRSRCSVLGKARTPNGCRREGDVKGAESALALVDLRVPLQSVASVEYQLASAPGATAQTGGCVWTPPPPKDHSADFRDASRPAWPPPLSIGAGSVTFMSAGDEIPKRAVVLVAHRWS